MIDPKDALGSAGETVREVAGSATKTVTEVTDAADRRVRELGSFIREQRETAQLSVRLLAKRAGVSNPYLSQIERGLRKPSAEILQAIASALRISAETLYVKAGILEEHRGDTAGAILADQALTDRQRRALLEIYRSFLSANGDDPEDQRDARQSKVDVEVGQP